MSALNGMTPPPDNQPQDAQGPASALMGGMPMSQGQPSPQQPPQAQQAPQPPTHQQTVAALRHFGALETEAMQLLADPDCGKADMKSKIIDGATRLVGDGEFTPAQAVQQLGSVPDRPFEQKQWLEKQLAMVVQAQNAVLDLHRAGHAAGLDVGVGAPQGNPDSHLDVLGGLAKQFQGNRNA